MGRFVSAGLILLAAILGLRVATSSLFKGYFSQQLNSANQIASTPLQPRTTGFSSQSNQQLSQRLDAKPSGQKPLPPNPSQQKKLLQTQPNQPIPGRW